MIKQLIKTLSLPKNEILYLHVQLKGLSSKLSYSELTKRMIYFLEEFYCPKTILVPTFTYSFTKTGIYDLKNTPSEVGRFSEEVRKLYDYENRSLNPVFSVIDTNMYMKKYLINENTAFGKNSLFDLLYKEKHVIVNINLNEIILAFLHYIEEFKKVDYRFNKKFSGRILCQNDKELKVEYNYYVRNYDMDTRWRRSKVESFLISTGSLFFKEFNNVKLRWMYSDNLFQDIEKKLEENQRYLIID
jgi:aminoglycoside 3-N-acetyltransferase